MFDLIKEGFDIRLVTGVIDKGHAEARSVDMQIAQLKRERSLYLEQTREELGINALEGEMRRREQECQEQIRAFDSESISSARKAQHREEWLATHRR